MHNEASLTMQTKLSEAERVTLAERAVKPSSAVKRMERRQRRTQDKRQWRRELIEETHDVYEEAWQV